MDMTNIILTAVIGVIFSIIGFIIKNSIIGEMKEIKTDIHGIKQDISASRELMIRDYITKAEVDKREHDNKASHANFWGEVNLLKERVKGIEVTQVNCKSCNGK